MFVALDIEGRVVLANKRACSVLGRTEPSLVGRDWFKTCVPARVQEQVREAFRNVIEGNDSLAEYSEYAVVTSGGEERLVAWHNVLLRDAWGSPTGTVSSGEDITERRQAEERMRGLLQSLPDAVLYQTGAGVEYVSENIETVLGIPAREFLRNRARFPELIHPDDRPRLVAEFKQWLQAGAPGVHEAEFRARRGDGTYIWLLDRARAAFRSADGKYSTIGVMLDITARKRVEQELEHYRRELEELAEDRTRELKRTQVELLKRERLATLGQIAGSIAHELRNPLGAIRNATYFLNMVLTRELKDKAGRHLQIINEEIERSDKIITSLLDYARGRPTNPVASPVVEIVEDALGMARLPHGVRVQTRFADRLPLLDVDDAQITQVFANLFTNASQAMAGRGLITVTAEPVDRGVRIRVTDNGPGIAPEHMPRMFEPLFSTKTFGVGLGLAVCKSFVESNRGEIAVESTPGKGATFIVTLPAATTDET
jgi:PAS domain S-box-containing protein